MKLPKVLPHSQLPRIARQPDLTLYGDTFAVIRDPKPIIDPTRDDPAPRPDVPGLEEEPPSPTQVFEDNPIPEMANLGAPQMPKFAVDLTGPNLVVDLPPRSKLSLEGKKFLAALPTEGVTPTERQLLEELAQEF